MSSTTADGDTNGASSGGGARRGRAGASRRNLPTGRALVGGLLVTMAAVVVFAAYAGANERPSTVGRGRPTRPRPRRSGSAPTTSRSGRSRCPPRSPTASFSDASALIGAVTLGPVGAGELVQEGAVRLDPTARRDRAEAAGPEFSFPVDRERALAGDVRPGEEVDLLATFGSGSDATTEVLARGARVLHVQEARTGTLGSSGPARADGRPRLRRRGRRRRPCVGGRRITLVRPLAGRARRS